MWYGGLLGDDLAVSNSVLLPAGTRYWFERTETELDVLVQYDISIGNTMTSDGESRIYSPVGGGRLDEDTVVTVTRRRGIEWNTWFRKPRNLIEGLITLNGVPRLIMFQKPVQS